MTQRHLLRENSAAGSQRAPTAQSHPAARQQPIVRLQSIIGNQAVHRLLIQREASGERASPEEEARRAIVGLIESEDRYITRTLEHIEFALQPQERERKLPLIQSVKNFHQITGVLSFEMIAMLQKGIEPVPIGAEHMASLFNLLRKRVSNIEDMTEGLKNPREWYNNHLKKLQGFTGF